MKCSGVSTFRKWRPYWVKLMDHRHAIGCVCVHHAKHAMLESAARKLRASVHRCKTCDAPGTCRFGNRCDCECQVCSNDAPLLHAAVCPTDGELPRLCCALQECDQCGLEKVLVCNRKESRNQEHLKGRVRLMQTVTRSIPGYDDRSKVEPVSVDCSLKQIFDDIRNEFSFTLMHDYLAKRLASCFHHDLHELPANEECWVMDYIENFSCFQEYALQQDHYGHKQVTLFIILCIRHRRADESVQPSFKLPGHLTAELHAFLSEDTEHDAGFAQLCIHMVMQKKEKECRLPKRVRNWSDGGRAHFKNYRQLLFMSEIATRYGTKWWWSFFQSCHGEYPQPLEHSASLPDSNLAATGKGMHDGAGAWLKSAVARACLSGVGINNAEEFFQYCIQFLATNATNANFTSQRSQHMHAWCLTS